MRTVIIITVGLILAIAVLRLAPERRRTLAAIIFTLAWMLLSIWNLSVGLSHGFTLGQEIPIHLVLFGVPTATAWALWWKNHRARQ